MILENIFTTSRNPVYPQKIWEVTGRRVLFIAFIKVLSLTFKRTILVALDYHEFLWNLSIWYLFLFQKRRGSRGAHKKHQRLQSDHCPEVTKKKSISQISAVRPVLVLSTEKLLNHQLVFVFSKTVFMLISNGRFRFWSGISERNYPFLLRRGPAEKDQKPPRALASPRKPQSEFRNAHSIQHKKPYLRRTRKKIGGSEALKNRWTM